MKKKMFFKYIYTNIKWLISLLINFLFINDLLDFLYLEDEPQKETSNKTTNTLLTLAGLKGGIELAKQMPTPAGKAAALAGTLAITHTVNAFANKYSSKISNAKNFISYLVDNTEFSNNANINNFPLNLVPELINFTNIEILFLFILLNSFIGIIFKDKEINYNKYLPNNKIGKILEFLLRRHINLWSKTSISLFIYSWICIIICVILSKIGLYTILNTFS